MAISKFNLAQHQRAERKLLLTVAEWTDTAEGRFYVPLLSEPANWYTNYTDYYTKSGDTYTKVTGSSAPTWEAGTYYNRVQRELLGRRTEDSAVEYNPDTQTSTDILGINYTDVNKTQPQQDFDPYLILGGSRLGEKLNDIRKRNALSEISQFTLYIITAFVGNSSDGYEAEMHVNCTITYTSIGGDANVNMPISAYFSNEITNGTVDKLGDDFEFSPDIAI